jgi:hypothetical protein
VLVPPEHIPNLRLWIDPIFCLDGMGQTFNGWWCLKKYLKIKVLPNSQKNRKMKKTQIKDFYCH